MGKAYTRAVIEACSSVDEFIDVQDFLRDDITVLGERPEAILHVLPVYKIAERAKKINIPLRIGTTNRIYHWHTCNKLIKLSRKKSSLHEAQLNLKLLQAFGIDKEFSLEEVGQSFSMNDLLPLPEEFATLFDKERFNLILHPKSQGSGREWGLENFINLIKILDPERFRIFISGVESERGLLQPLFSEVGESVRDITGLMNLSEFISFISKADGLIASGTGPIHIAGALGIHAFGIFPPIKPIHPGRWSPLGPKAQAFVLDRSCTDCKGEKTVCHCINEVKPVWLKEALEAASVMEKVL